MLSGLFVLPLWNITLEAPQYPIPIGMDIYINQFKGAGDNDIKNINIMNHYVGMKEIPEVIPEFSVFPYFVGGMIVLGVVFGFLGKKRLYLAWLSLMILLGSIAMYDFYSWEYDYGHNLRENAAIKFTDKDGQPMTYQPPLIGAKTILNFRAISLPRSGAIFMVAGMVLAVLAFVRANKETHLNASVSVLALIPLLGIFMSCEVKPQPINYGVDACQFCKMTIVDKQHAAQIVTEKGRVYKYDAIECMLNDLKNWDRPPVALELVADYAHPGEFTDAKNAHFLISDAIPSPMGASLSAFENQELRKKTLTQVGGETLEWVQVRKKFTQNE